MKRRAAKYRNRVIPSGDFQQCPDYNKCAHLRVRNLNGASFVLIIYGYTAGEMLVVPPPVSPGEALRKRGIDPHEWVGSIFEVW